MGDWVIYTIGDIYYLRNIFVALASMFGGPSGDDLAGLIKTAMLFGVIVYAVKMVGASRTDMSMFTSLLISLTMYFGFIEAKTDVVLEDVNTGTILTVADVPLGVAVVGGVTSLVGYKMSGMFNTAFALPDTNEAAFETGHISALETLTAVRDGLGNPINWVGASSYGGGDYRYTLTNYIQDCTLSGIDLGAIEPSQIYSNPDPIAAIEFPSTIYTTVVKLDGPVEEEKSCTDAHADIVNASNSLLSRGLITDLIPLIYKDKSSALIDPFMVENKVASALNFVGLGALDAQDYAIANIINPIYHDAVQGKYETNRQFNSALALKQAIEQRNIGWGADQSLFIESFRPMYTFIEGLVYAITPFMAILMVMGPMGMALVGKQFGALIWIQLWMPLMSICNLYIHTAINNQMDQLQSGASPFPSIGSLLSSHNVFDTYIAFGGYMTASIPVLAAFVLTGGAVALGNVASRMQERGEFNAKQVVPDVSAPSAVMDVGSRSSADELSGVRASGVEKSMTALTSSVGSVSQAAANKNISRNAVSTFGKNFAANFLAGQGSRTGTGLSADVSSTVASALTESGNNSYKKAFNLAKKYGATDENAAAFGANLVTSVGPGGKGVIGKLAAALPIGTTGMTNAEQKDTQSQFKQEALELSDDFSSEEGFKNDLNEDLRAGLTSTKTKEYADSLESNQARNLTNLAEESFSKQRSLQQESSRAISSGSVRQQDPMQYVEQNKDKVFALNNALSSRLFEMEQADPSSTRPAQIRDQLAANEKSLNGVIYDPQARLLAATMTTMHENGMGGLMDETLNGPASNAAAVTSQLTKAEETAGVVEENVPKEGSVKERVKAGHEAANVQRLDGDKAPNKLMKHVNSLSTKTEADLAGGNSTAIQDVGAHQEWAAKSAAYKGAQSAIPVLAEKISDAEGSFVGSERTIADSIGDVKDNIVGPVSTIFEAGQAVFGAVSDAVSGDDKHLAFAASYVGNGGEDPKMQGLLDTYNEEALAKSQRGTTRSQGAAYQAKNESYSNAKAALVAHVDEHHFGPASERAKSTSGWEGNPGFTEMENKVLAGSISENNTVSGWFGDRFSDRDSGAKAGLREAYHQEQTENAERRGMFTGMSVAQRDAHINEKFDSIWDSGAADKWGSARNTGIESINAMSNEYQKHSAVQDPGKAPSSGNLNLKNIDIDI